MDLQATTGCGSKLGATEARPACDVAEHADGGWPVDVQRTDVTGEIDLGQLEFNLALTPAQRLEQNDAWVEFIHIARRAGRKRYARQSPRLLGSGQSVPLANSR